MTARLTVIVALAFTTVAGVASLAGAQPVFDHLTCFKISDPVTPRVGYTVDINPKELDKFAPMLGDRTTGGIFRPGCRVSLGAKYFCIDVEAANAKQIVPPYTVATWLQHGPDPGDRLCYKLKCPPPVSDVEYPVVDQFGARTIKVRRTTAFFCTPAVRQVDPAGPCQSNANGACIGQCPDGKLCLGISSESCGCAEPEERCSNMSSLTCSQGLCPALWENCTPSAGGCSCLPNN